jgi:hypothetical protein
MDERQGDEHRRGGVAIGRRGGPRAEGRAVLWATGVAPPLGSSRAPGSGGRRKVLIGPICHQSRVFVVGDGVAPRTAGPPGALSPFSDRYVARAIGAVSREPPRRFAIRTGSLAVIGRARAVALVWGRGSGIHMATLALRPALSGEFENRVVSSSVGLELPAQSARASQAPGVTSKTRRRRSSPRDRDQTRSQQNRCGRLRRRVRSNRRI